MLARGGFGAAEHARELFNPRGALEALHAHLERGGLAHRPLRIAACRDLRQVRHAQHLALLAQALQRAADGLGHRAADARIHFVEYQRRHRGCLRRHQLDREADARKLAARRHFGERAQRQAGMRGHLELHLLHTGGAWLVQLVQRHCEARCLHRQLRHGSSNRFRQTLRASGPHGGEFFGGSVVPGPGCGDFALDRLRIRRQLKLVQTLLQLREAHRQFLRPQAMPARGAVQRLDACLHLAQCVRIEIHPRGIVAQLAHRLARLRLGRLEHLDYAIQIGVVLRQRPQTARDSGELSERLGAGEQAGAVLQSLVLGRDLLPFALARRQLFQIGHALGDIGALGLTLRELGARLRGNVFQALPVAEGLRSLARQRFGVGMRVEQLALRGGAQQRLVRMLAVQIEQPFAGFLELRKRRGMSVDEAARAAGAVERAAQNQLAGVAGQVALGEPR